MVENEILNVEDRNKLEKILKDSDQVMTVLQRASSLNLADYYIGAGCIAQTVWNSLSGREEGYGIKDIDFVYYDDKNLDEASEAEVIRRVRELYKDIPIEIDVKNQARVHLWYEKHFGYGIAPYPTLEAAIDSWPTTATAIGIRMNDDDSLKIYAPYGLTDLLRKTVRPNKKQITETIYARKVEAWLSRWNDLRIIPWEEDSAN